MKPTINDVARRAGVSLGTVSNALSGKRPVAEETKNRIFKVMEEIGYQPNLMARGLVNGRSHMLSIVINELRDLHYYGYLSVMTGIQQEAEKFGYSLMLHFIKSSQKENMVASINQISAHQADGIIWANHEIGSNWNWIQALQIDQYPPIVFMHMHPDPQLNVITIDNKAGARLAVTHLLAQGAKKIGIITGPMDWWEAQARVQGWQEALETRGIELDPSYIVHGDWFAESGQEGLRTLVRRHPDIDAVFACNDSMALGAINAAYKAGISIPEHLLIVGFDDMPEAASFCPPLTSIRQNFQVSGQLAVKELIRIIEDDPKNINPPRQHVLQPKLIIRQSTNR